MTGSITNAIKSTGKITPLQTSTLPFAKQGTVSKIYKKEGDTVKAGDLIAEIDATSAHKDIESARITVSNAKNNYDKLFTSTSESDKIRAENTYTESKANLALLQSQYNNLVTNHADTLTETEADIHLLEGKVTLSENELKYAKQNITTDTTSNNIERDVANGYSLLESSYQTLSPSLKTISDILLLENK
jgi:multidrug efflux pump subunit AcrA (membrane-fusion protein)